LTQAFRKHRLVPMNTSPSPSPDKIQISDITRPLPPLLGALLVVAAGTGLVFELRGLSFGRGFAAILVASALTILFIGGFAAVGFYLDQRTGKDVAFRLAGAAVGFVVLATVLFALAPTILGPNVMIR
jgi:hypothetical protein